MGDVSLTKIANFLLLMTRNMILKVVVCFNIVLQVKYVNLNFEKKPKLKIKNHNNKHGVLSLEFLFLCF